MKFKVLTTTLYGDYGHLQRGAVFETPDDPGTLKRMKKLEAGGSVMQWRPPIDRKAYTVYQNKAMQPPLNKSK